MSMAARKLTRRPTRKLMSMADEEAADEDMADEEAADEEAADG